jgi:eukaryotic-like serine/threonine-protein kinase
VLITGPAGIGKSRLCHETLQRIRAMLPDAVSWTARGGEIGGDNAPLSVLGSLLSHIREDVGDVASAFLRLATAALENGPLILVLEDFQYADGPSVLAIEQALGQLRHRPLFVLVLARPDMQLRFSRIWSVRDAQEMSLGGLAPRAATKMVQHALGDGVEETAIGALVRRAGGHPFYLEELIRAAAAGRGDALPSTVLAMVQVRLAVLTPEERRFLRAASIFGGVFWVRGVLQLLGGGSPAVAQTLIDRNILTRHQKRQWPGEDELAFCEPLVREAVYATVTALDRARGHALATAWLASLDGARARVTK